MKKLLIANRGEIACRIIRTAKQRGLATVAVYSEPDVRAQHVLQADEAICIGPAAALDSYLKIDNIMAAARRTGADALHPGYGFLSENPALVDACNQVGVAFVGPTAAAMRAMGLKDAAKRLMSEAGVPVVPGYHGESQDADLLLTEARRIGYPVLIKARAGGGGKGMRLVHEPEDFIAALQSAQRESQASFGDAHVLIEKYINKPRHIEVQVFGDSHGNVVHLFERDCSLQRRHQKVIEEAPAPGMTDAMRAAMTQAAVTAAKAIDYQNAGTIEFIVDGSDGLHEKGFWFMEMNTRLQVEHPVTEAITGVDLVDWQLRVAAGEVLPMNQEDIAITGHAVEARLYAENPAAGFLPATGHLDRLQISGLGRVDSGVIEGDEVLPYYDPLLAKLVTHASDRSLALGSLSRQLAESIILGTTTNREFLWHLLSHDDVLAGNFDTGFIDHNLEQLVVCPRQRHLLAAACVQLADPWASDDEPLARRLGAWQLWAPLQRKVRLMQDGRCCTYHLTRPTESTSSKAWRVSSDDCPVLAAKSVDVVRIAPDRMQIDGVNSAFWTTSTATGIGRVISVQLGPYAMRFTLPVSDHNGPTALAEDSIISPMPGKVVAVHCAEGDEISAGQPLVCVEAMKMQQDLSCQRDGIVAFVGVSVGDQVSEGLELLRLEAQS